MQKNTEKSYVGTRACDIRCGKSETCFNQSEAL